MPGLTTLLLGIAMLVFGVGPLLLYIEFGPADGNPIGLGLLAMVAVPAGLGCSGLGLLRMMIELLVRRSG